MKKFFGEFKEFISRGNVLDMAVGVIIATAFGAITTTLVQKVIMPVIGCIFGGIDLDKLNIVLKEAVMEGEEVVKEAVVMEIGTFITAVINFIIVALIVFCIVKAFNKARAAAEAKKKAEEEAKEEEPPEPSAEEKLLTEIRDLLRERK
ncbi:MAG: large-conductance mechanosensitive channel protein MscL [Oscillospiraceae bacterium]|nr:large-conductance mechanosensitive channel protein MscL [Oscillospiraceae bacterium]